MRSHDETTHLYETAGRKRATDLIPTATLSHRCLRRTGAISGTIALMCLTASCVVNRVVEEDRGASTHEWLQMPDGKQWLTRNLDVAAQQSYCYADSALNCRKYGRLYTWVAAQQACRSLGEAWRLPTDPEWRELAKHFGGEGNDSNDSGRTAYNFLMMGGKSGFNALLGGGRGTGSEKYDRLEAHGFYWTASENDSATAPFYNFGRGGLALYRQAEGEKQRAFSVRCVRP